MKTLDQIEKKLEEAAERAREGTKVRGMSYEEGVAAALYWVVEKDADDPLEL